MAVSGWRCGRACLRDPFTANVGGPMLARAVIAFLVLPGMVAFAIPVAWLWHTAHVELAQPFGLVPLAIGIVALLWCVRDFYVSGKGTLAPWAPPEEAGCRRAIPLQSQPHVRGCDVGAPRLGRVLRLDEPACVHADGRDRVPCASRLRRRALVGSHAWERVDAVRKSRSTVGVVSVPKVARAVTGRARRRRGRVMTPWASVRAIVLVASLVARGAVVRVHLGLDAVGRRRSRLGRRRSAGARRQRFSRSSSCAS